jgi:hypothetical protein
MLFDASDLAGVDRVDKRTSLRGVLEPAKKNAAM